MAKKQTSTKRIKKKKWYPIIAPKLFGEKVLGESLLTEPGVMKGRYMNMNMMNITGDPKKQSTNIQFLIKDVREGQGITEIVKYERINSFIKRMVRRGRNKIEDSFVTKTKEGRRVRVKTITITNSYASNAVATKIRQTTSKILREMINNNTFEKNIEDLLKGMVMKDVKRKLSKITPVRIFDVRAFKFEPLKGDFSEPKKEPEVEEEPAVKEAEEKPQEEEKAEEKEGKEVKPKKEEKKEEKKEKEETKAKKATVKKEKEKPKK